MKSRVKKSKKSWLMEKTKLRIGRKVVTGHFSACWPAKFSPLSRLKTQSPPQTLNQTPFNRITSSMTVQLRWAAVMYQICKIKDPPFR